MSKVWSGFLHMPTNYTTDNQEVLHFRNKSAAIF